MSDQQQALAGGMDDAAAAATYEDWLPDGECRDGGAEGAPGCTLDLGEAVEPIGA